MPPLLGMYGASDQERIAAKASIFAAQKTEKAKEELVKALDMAEKSICAGWNSIKHGTGVLRLEHGFCLEAHSWMRPDVPAFAGECSSP